MPHAHATHYFLRLTRARGKSSQREGNALLYDFWYFSSQKSTIKEKLLYDSLRRQQATALRTKPKHNQQTKQKCAFHPVSARAKFTPAYLFLAGVQVMRARICSAISCAVFARVVWLGLRRAVKLPIFALSFAAHTCHAWLARLTRARRTKVRKEDGASPPC